MRSTVLLVALVVGVMCPRVSAQIGRTPSQGLPTPTFNIGLDHSTNSGTIQLVWEVDTLESLSGELDFELQQGFDSLFDSTRIRYTGPDMASYISGLKNGDYYFRVRTVTDHGNAHGDWSGTVTVTVEHHSLTLALTLAGLGGLVFLLTVAVVVQGTRASEREFRSQTETATPK